MFNCSKTPEDRHEREFQGEEVPRHGEAVVELEQKSEGGEAIRRVVAVELHLEKHGERATKTLFDAL